MAEQRPDPNLDTLAAQAQHKVDAQNARLAAARAARPSGPGPLKGIVTAVLVAALAASLWIQWPRFTEPFEFPDAATFSGIAEADLDTLAGVITAFRVSQGRLPEALDDVNLPDGLRELVSQSRVKYQRDGDRYQLTWKSPQWDVAFDSATGKTTVAKAAQ